MAVKIKSIKSMVHNQGIKLLVHGLAGAGKTVLCCTTGESTLLISAESGLLSVRNAPDYIKGAEVDTFEDLEDLYEFLVDDSGPDQTFKWVALDSITEIAERVLAHEMSEAKDPRQAYQRLTDRVMEYMKQFRDLKGYHVVMSCKQSRIPQDQGPTIFAPMMPGQKLPQQIPYLFDEVFALRVEKDEDGEDYRILQTQRDTKYEAKDRSGVLELFEEPNLKNIAAKILEDVGEVEYEEEQEGESEEHVAEQDEGESQSDDTGAEESSEVMEEESSTASPDEDEASEPSGEGSSSGNEPEIAQKKMYWVHEASETVGMIPKGDKIPNGFHEQVDTISRVKYKKLLEEGYEDDEQEDD